MKMISLSSTSPGHRTATATLLMFAFVSLTSLTAQAANFAALLDDFSDPSRNKNGAERILIDDKAAGSQSHATKKCTDGVLAVEGELVPGRGVPAFISLVSLLSPEGKTEDLSTYTGVRLRVKVIKGILSVQVGSSAITNFDYHTSGPVQTKRGEFQEVRMPFKEMKRGWSEQTALNLNLITSVNLVSFGLAKGPIAYQVDEIGFY